MVERAYRGMKDSETEACFDDLIAHNLCALLHYSVRYYIKKWPLQRYSKQTEM